jgi:hypothetical protein
VQITYPNLGEGLFKSIFCWWTSSGVLSDSDYIPCIARSIGLLFLNLYWELKIISIVCQMNESCFIKVSNHIWHSPIGYMGWIMTLWKLLSPLVGKALEETNRKFWPNHPFKKVSTFWPNLPLILNLDICGM